MKTLRYIIEQEQDFWTGDGYKEYDIDLTVKAKPNGPQLQKFLDKYGFKPVRENEELVDAVKYTRFHTSRFNSKILLSNWYKQLKDGTYLIVTLDGIGHIPQKYTQVVYFEIWGESSKTKWILKKRIGDNGYYHTPKEAEEVLLKNKLDKK